MFNGDHARIINSIKRAPIYADDPTLTCKYFEDVCVGAQIDSVYAK